MLAYKRYVTVKDTGNLMLTGLPFKSGQCVEVVMIAEDEEKEAILKRLKTLFKETQNLPQVKTISEDQISKEIRAYRADQ